ncbi:MAG TPA: hypothetical protein DD723_10400 [Candidatus Omnitrophica bacterium]|nr:MAG: hypothetical protein A2Z81_06080 [Omnitrophica WOR_2 bacterium GWA2_45_18]HBR15926.1 hypothetical protein [Candidatus Omnitrophota bacterium]
MFRKLIKNKKAQNTAEYAILISLVVAGIIAMQTYAQRALQARVRAAAMYLTNQTDEIGNTAQYEPYYLTTNYEVTSTDQDVATLGEDKVEQEITSSTTRAAEGFRESGYDAALGLTNGL